MTILHGIEVDILPNGQLDYDDDTLAQFDIVLASLHEDDGQDGGQLTRRSLAAIRHPLVNILCHPANQLVGHFDGYDLDFDAMLRRRGGIRDRARNRRRAEPHGSRRSARAAAATAGRHADDRQRLPPRRALGRQMGFGVGTARRGWVEAHQVLNTRPLSAVREFIAAKRRGRP